MALREQFESPAAVGDGSVRPGGRWGDGPLDSSWPAIVTILADEVRAHLRHRDLDGRSLVLPERGGGRFAARHLARELLAEAERCLEAPAEGGAPQGPAHWAHLAARLRAIEEVVHGDH